MRETIKDFNAYFEKQEEDLSRLGEKVGQLSNEAA